MPVDLAPPQWRRRRRAIILRPNARTLQLLALTRRHQHGLKRPKYALACVQLRGCELLFAFQVAPVAQLQLAVNQTSPGILVIRVGSENPFEVRTRFSPALDREKRRSPVIQQIDTARVEPEGLTEVRHRLFMTAEHRKPYSVITKRLQIVRLQRQSLIEGRDRILMAREACKRGALVVPGIRTADVCADRFLARQQRIVVAFQPEQRRGAVALYHPELGPGFKNPIETLKRLSVAL